MDSGYELLHSLGKEELTDQMIFVVEEIFA